MHWREILTDADRNKAPADAHAAQDVPIFFWRLAYTQRITETNVSKEQTRTLIRNNVNALSLAGWLRRW